MNETETECLHTGVNEVTQWLIIYSSYLKQQGS